VALPDKKEAKLEKEVSSAEANSAALSK